MLWFEKLPQGFLRILRHDSEGGKSPPWYLATWTGSRHLRRANAFGGVSSAAAVTFLFEYETVLFGE